MTEAPCHALLNQLSDYIDGELEEALCAEIERHMAGCDNCRVVVNTLAKTVTLFRELPEVELSDETQNRLFKVLQLERSQQSE